LRLVLLGPPGCGKGTQAERLSLEYGLARISTGDMLRDEVKLGSELGRRVKAVMDEGRLVPDGVVLELVQKRITAQGLVAGYILDGFPRTLPQAEALTLLLSGEEADLDAVISLEIEDDAIVRRLSHRRTCSACGKLYNILTAPPAKDGICDSCGGSLMQRDDDREETIRERLGVYRSETTPLKDFYSKAGLLHEVNGDRTVDQVYDDVRSIVAGLT
jgi:adenylate kinase